MNYTIQQIKQAASQAGIDYGQLKDLLNNLPQDPVTETWESYVTALVNAGAPDNFTTFHNQPGARSFQYTLPRYIMTWIGRYKLSLPCSDIAQRLNYVNHTSCVNALKQLESMSMQPEKYLSAFIELDFVRDMIEQNTPKVKKYLVG